MSAIVKAVEPIVAGDRMTRDEFLQRAEGDQNLKLAELVGGRVYIMAPVSDDHAGPDILLQTCFATYAATTPGCAARSNATCFMGDDAPLPDAYLRVLTEYGGGARVSKNGFLEGAPELIAEVCMTSSSYDLHDKMELYRTAGVKEYVVFLVYKRVLQWFRLTGAEYEKAAPPADRIYRSVTFPGLWIDETAVARDDGAKALAVLNRGLKSAEHKNFVRQLAAQKKKYGNRRD